LLADIAKKDSDWNVRMAAVEKLTDQNAPADTAKTNADRASPTRHSNT
jgi:hypothetical protein